jgi:hypothetical protein
MDAERKILSAIFKPSEQARQFRKQNPSIDSEWDFSRCPVNETSECFFWEYTREIPSIKQWVKKLRASCSDKTFDGFKSAYGRRVMSFDLKRTPQTFGAIFYFAPEWPDNEYAFVNAQERRRRLIPPDSTPKFPSIIQAWPVFAKLYLDRQFFEKLEHAIRETGKPTVHDSTTSSTDAIFNIQWAFPDNRLKKEFAAWLKNNRPKGTWASRRGEGVSLVKQHQRALRHLAAWRLLGKYSLDCETAEELTRKNGKPLYSGQDNWLAAKREAEKRLQGMANFAAGRS